MGYLTKQIADEVGRLSQERGHQYYIRGAVKQIDGDGTSVNAVVQGTMRYKVEIMSIDDFLDYSCSCPYYERDLEPCKHIWATCLAAEERGYLRNTGDNREPDPFAAGRESFLRTFGEKPAAAKKPAATWKQQLVPIFSSLEAVESRRRFSAPVEREFIYIIDGAATLAEQRVVLEVVQRERLVNGTWGKLKTKKLRLNEIEEVSDARDRQILAVLFGSRRDSNNLYFSYLRESTDPNFNLPAPLWDVALPLMCATNRCILRMSMSGAETAALQWDDGEPWEFYLKAEPAADGEHYSVNGLLRRGEGEMALSEPALLVAGGLVFYNDRVARLNDHGCFAWMSLLRERKGLSIPKADGEAFVAELLRFERRPQLELPEDLQFEEVALQPKPSLVVKPGPSHPFRQPRVVGKLSFDYDGEKIPYERRGAGVYQKVRRRIIRRDLSFEAAARQRMTELGFRSVGNNGDAELYGEQLPRVVRALTREGWQVEAEGKLYRTAGALKLEVKSSVDWFDLDGSAVFDDAQISLPRLLRAIKQGESWVKLDDGTLGVLPEDWLKKYGLLAGLGTLEADRLRFTRPQAGLLDALLATEPGVAVDAVFARVRQELRDFSGVTPADPPAEFQGELRGYQREGLGWLFFLQRFGFGGCLADDMGLGKTIQVLALLEARRAGRSTDGAGSPRPSLVIVPRSLVFHWKKEAARFAPGLQILDHSGAARLKPGRHFADYDLVITTYGTLRRDALHFKEQRFDYCVLDEAQAVKNAGTLSAKAVRLLRAEHRLAMSGTPVENHLGELWSLFEFLNPGMLGSASVFASAGRNPDERTRAVLAKALRPFILRRTKGQVARELPEKTEQTIYCDLEPREKKLYNELRDYYRARLLKKDAAEDNGRFKIQVLEALLRLRQAACHPGLIDKTRNAEPSAKIDTLLAQLDQVLDENHKVLVFSQFTSLLAILRRRLDSAHLPYAYLDGRTRDREARVERFQNDPGVKLFLISLKAGGLGLNLHAAEYVYLLDPWWNPAVETQAIDRAHRIGQTRHVFAYRLIARDTVEEKVLALQQSKRDLADAVISADNSVMRNLTREDLELLLS